MPGYLAQKNDGNYDSVILALVRWLVPHPEAMDRDSKLRPVCPPPFDINHALWTFARTPHRRFLWNGRGAGRQISRQLHMFPGRNERAQRRSSDNLSRAFYDLIHVDTIGEIMNCTCIDQSSDVIMQTVTIPFNGE